MEPQRMSSGLPGTILEQVMPAMQLTFRSRSGGSPSGSHCTPHGAAVALVATTSSQAATIQPQEEIEPPA